MKVLFIAYYFKPFQGVGSKRVTYWAENIKKLDAEVENVSVITATKGATVTEYIDEVKYIPTAERSIFGKLLKFDKGASWYPKLKQYIVDNIKTGDFDYVILTGNPFLHFYIIRKFKKLGIKTITDFRDPMAINPRGSKPKSFKQRVKLRFLKFSEKRFIALSDICITVNKYCKDLLVGSREYSQKIKIIDNGYDERNISNLSTKAPNFLGTDLVYSGSLYKDRCPDNLIIAIQMVGNYTFHHIGDPFEQIIGQKNVISHGFVSYEKNLTLINTFDITLIFTSGHPFESTTKVFDYIGLNKIILIITDGELQAGALADITKDYPYVFWAHNTVQNIKEALLAIKKVESTERGSNFTSESYSRRSGLKSLLSLMK